MTAPRIVIQVDVHGTVKVLSNTPDVQVLVVDRDVEGTEGEFSVGGQPAAVDSLLEGLPRVDPHAVEAIFAEVGSKLPQAAADAGLVERQVVQARNVKKAWFPDQA